ncbi:LLM class flavin-dependent oxidoreductase [Streptomyces canus]|uniref:LLM class flavin-dependent oxidoreductase n=1 Tax=Streptomyces canus TaxID=58343 RepID=UPI0033B4BA16
MRHLGAQFDVDLASALPRSAQGHPVIFQAGDSGEWRDFAARNADVIFSAHGTDFDDALAFAEDIRTRLRAAGRPDDDLRILPGTEIIIGASEDEAQEKKRWIRLQQVTRATTLAIAGLLWGIDLSDRDADGPLPTVRRIPSSATTTAPSAHGASPTRTRSWPNEGRRRRRTAGHCARPSSRSPTARPLRYSAAGAHQSPGRSRNRPHPEDQP